MHDHPNRVEWDSWWRTRRDDLGRPEKMIVQLGRGWRCLLCESSVDSAARADHHAAHMLELDAWRAAQTAEDPTGPKPDSIRRSRDREARRQRQAEQAEAFGRSPYLYAVERVDEVNPKDKHDQRVRPVLRRRLRHPRAETLARVRELHAQGVMPQAIAGTLHISDNYARRLVRQIEGQRASNVAL